MSVSISDISSETWLGGRAKELGAGGKLEVCEDGGRTFLPKLDPRSSSFDRGGNEDVTGCEVVA